MVCLGTKLEPLLLVQVATLRSQKQDEDEERCLCNGDELHVMMHEHFGTL